jgi:formamidopyrimidine-DNA glycosylase
MPELPEVEMARRCLERWAKNRRVQKVIVHEPRVLGRGRGAGLGALAGARFTAFDRRGKNLLLTLQKGGAPLGLWSHLGMTGKWLLRRRSDEPPRFSRVELLLDDGAILHYADMRLFGRLRLVPGGDFGRLPELGALGPDPLRDGLDAEYLARTLGRVKKPVKLALMDQNVIAGLGNIQASEALFRARLNPLRPARSLSPEEIRRLKRGILDSLQHTLKKSQIERLARGAGDIIYVEERKSDRAKAAEGSVSDNPFLVYGRAGELCPACRRTRIVRVIQSGRATYYCPRCQPGARHLSPSTSRPRATRRLSGSTAR